MDELQKIKTLIAENKQLREEVRKIKEEVRDGIRELEQTIIDIRQIIDRGHNIDITDSNGSRNFPIV